MSSTYNPLPPSLTTKLALTEDAEIYDSLHTIPSNFDLALNGGMNRTFLSPNPPKGTETSLLDPEAFRRLSVSTASSIGRARSVSPYPYASTTHPSTPRSWKALFLNFWQQNQGLFLVTFSQLFGALMNATTRVLELEGEGMHPFQILFARQGLTAMLCTAWMWWSGVEGFPFGQRGIRRLLVARAFSGFFGIFGMYYSLQYLPVADAVVITFLAPSVASYGCYLFLKEPFPRSAQYASLISLLGVVLIARPTSFFASSSSSAMQLPSSTNTTSSALESEYPTPTSAQRLSAVGVAMIGVLGSAGAFTSIRWIGNRAHPLLSVNYFSTFCLLISTLALSLSTFTPLKISTSSPNAPSSTLSFALPNGIKQWTLLLFLGTCGFVMQFLLTKGLAAGGRTGGARATNMIYTNMLFALALDKIVFGTTPGWWSLGGSGLILGSAVWVAVRKGGGKEGASSREGRGQGWGRGGEVDEEEMGMLSTNGEALDEEVDRATDSVGEEQNHNTARNEALQGEEHGLRDFPPGTPQTRSDSLL